MTLQTNILRKKDGLEKLYPKFFLYVNESDHFLLASRKRPKNLTANYLISLDHDTFEKDSKFAVGKVRANFMGTVFNIFSNGKNPKNTKEADEVRNQLGVVTYVSAYLIIFRLQTCLVLMDRGNSRFTFLTLKAEIRLSSRTGRRKKTKFIGSLKTRTTKRSSCLRIRIQFGLKVEMVVYLEHKAYVVGFSNGRIEKGSVKNFQLVEKDNGNFLSFF